MDVTIVFSFSLSRNKLLEEKNEMSIDSVLENAKRYFALKIMQNTKRSEILMDLVLKNIGD